MSKVELLAPAKNFKVIKAALQYADSFYFGVEAFNMRLQADNFKMKEDLPKIVQILHDQGKLAILATNILIYEHELDTLHELLEWAKTAGIDAVIVHDFATIQMAKELGLPFHISTQCNVSNSVAAKFYEHLGAQRIILARECTLNQIAEIKSKMNSAKIEVFIHGAMCTSISGRCYFSLDIDGTSANRGECAQPCRREWWVYDDSTKEYIYDGVRFLNSRDLCMVAHVPKLLDAHIDVFKIEGRMRDPHYVETVTRVYREAIEAYYDGTFSNKKVKYWIKDLKKVYNRGFTTGFYFGRPTAKDHQHKSPSNLSHFRMIELGSIRDYDPSSRIATITLTNGKLRVGDKIYVMGSKNSDTYFVQLIETLELNGIETNITPPASQTNPISVKTLLKGPLQVDDKLFIFTDQTYRHRRAKHRPSKRSDYYRLP
ncbi:MAG: U32 family peptidase [Promethearchaeota archaeon]|nr:MAG: U32 family peptidase [Candidatus Lokiarchaeota archaeon]